MPYTNIGDLPQDVKDKYSSEGQRAFLSAFNSTMESCEGDTSECEGRAFGAGHAAAQRATESDKATAAKVPEKYSHIDFTPPESVQNAAKRGLEMRSEHGRGGTEVGIARARDLSNGSRISPDTAKRMHSFFARHSGASEDKPGFNRGDDDYPSNGRIAWELWGGDAGEAWAGKLVRQMDAADEKEKKAIMDSIKIFDDDNPGLWRAIKSLLGIKPHINRSGFKMIDGGKRWIAWYSNAFGPDKDGEFISTKAIEDDVRRMNETGQYPDLLFFHLRATKHGKADAVGMAGRFAIATGTFDDTELADAFKAWYQDHDIKMSFGFDYDHDTKQAGTYHEVRTFEVSTVWPPDYAANQLTGFNINQYQEEAIMPAQLDALKAVFADNPDLLDQIVQQAEKATAQAEQQGVQYKATEPPAEAEKAEMKPDDEDDDGMDMKAMYEKMATMYRKMEDMYKRMMQEKPKDEEMEKAADPMAAIPPHILQTIVANAAALRNDDAIKATLRDAHAQAEAEKTVPISELHPMEVIAYQLDPENFQKSRGIKVANPGI